MTWTVRSLTNSWKLWKLQHQSTQQELPAAHDISDQDKQSGRKRNQVDQMFQRGVYWLAKPFQTDPEAWLVQVSIYSCQRNPNTSAPAHLRCSRHHIHHFSRACCCSLGRTLSKLNHRPGPASSVLLIPKSDNSYIDIEEIAEKAINEVSSGMVKDTSKTEDEVATKTFGEKANQGLKMGEGEKKSQQKS